MDRVSTAAEREVPTGQECPICFNALKKPYRPSCCKHVFCKSCLKKSLKGRRHCPVCRTPALSVCPVKDTVSLTVHVHVNTSRLRRYRSVPSLPTGFPEANSPVTGRSGNGRGSTAMIFRCPYCPESGLDELDLLQHCNSRHCRDTRPVVCPICVALPHGDPLYCSRDFIGHINLRHRFYSEDFMDVRQNDVINRQAALLASCNSLVYNRL